MDDQLQPVLNPIDQLLDKISVNSVFGKPTQVGDVTLIPVAEISAGFGYGFGRGSGKGSADSAGGGGGGSGGARPLGFIRVAADGVQFEPMIDIPRLGLAGMALAAWIMFWIAQSIKAARHS